jgi:WD40 repeat protein
LASGSFDKTVKVWNFDFKKEVTTLRGHKEYITSLAFSIEGKYLASGSYDKSIKLWNI